MKTYTIVCKKDDYALTIQKQLEALLLNKLERNDEHPDYVISIGGDGTLLGSIQRYTSSLDKVTFIGIHAGTLGFLATYQKEDLETIVEELTKDQPHYKYRDLLEVKVNEDTYYAFNEVRIENSYSTQLIDLYVDEEFLETFRGTGICISGSVGSTAYNKSLDGAVVSPDVSILQLSEIAGIHHNAYRSLGNSLILSNQRTITCHVTGNPHTILGMDQVVYPLSCESTIRVCVSKDQKVCFLDTEDYSFITRLKKAYMV